MAVDFMVGNGESFRAAQEAAERTFRRLSGILEDEDMASVALRDKRLMPLVLPVLHSRGTDSDAVKRLKEAVSLNAKPTHFRAAIATGATFKGVLKAFSPALPKGAAWVTFEPEAPRARTVKGVFRDIRLEDEPRDYVYPSEFQCA